jgi:beta-galactosidase
MQFTSDDSECTEFGDTARKSWFEINSRPFIAGGFIWTGFDYKGEPYPFNWPCINSNTGNLDVCGFEKSGFNLHQAFWSEVPMLHILPHWNLQGKEGTSVRVQIYTNCTEVELFQDGKSLGSKSVDKYNMVSYQVIYTAGKLSAIGRINGEIKAQNQVETSEKAYALALKPWHKTLNADGVDTTPITVSAVDEKGRFVPLATNMVKFQIKGQGKILGTGNGNPTCLEPDKAESRSLFGGLCQVIVRSDFEAGEIEILATAEGLQPAKLTIPCIEAVRRKYIPYAEPEKFVTGFRKTPVSNEKPDVNQKLESGDMNSWLHVNVGNGVDPAFSVNRGYSLYRATIAKSNAYSPVNIFFEGITGKAELYVDKILFHVKNSFDEERVTINYPASGGASLMIDVILDGNDGNAGISKPVKITYDR